MKRVKCLIVEDEDSLARLMEMQLQRIGFSVVGPVSTGADAIAAANAEKPDVALIDIVLDGDIDGIDAARRIQDHHNVPIIFVTAYGDAATLAEAKKVASAGYVLKPFTELQLKAAIDTALYNRELQRRLEKSESRYLITFEHAAVGIAQVGLDGRWLRVNRRLCEIIGYSVEELQSLTFQGITHPDDLEPTIAQVNRMLAGEIETFSMDKRYIRKHGATVWINLSVSLVRDSSGTPEHFISVVQDISRRKRYEEELETQSRSLQAFNKAMLGRETRIIELKEEIQRLQGERGKEPDFSTSSVGPDTVTGNGSASDKKAEEAPLPSLPLHAGTDSVVPGAHGKRSSWQKWVAGLVLLVCISATMIAWYFVYGGIFTRAREQFLFRARESERAIQDHLLNCELMLRGGAGMLAASKEVSRQDWKTYYENLNLSQAYRGIQGFGFSEWFSPSEKEAHIRRIRQEGFPDYKVYPDGDRPAYSAIVFLEPFDWRNQRAFGYDMFSEPTRREAMVMARDTGLTSMSGKVILVQETGKDVQAGFLIYVPVYRRHAETKTREQRRNALWGYVYSPFRMNNFIEKALPKGLDKIRIQIYSGIQPREDALMYHGGPASQQAGKERTPLFSRRSVIEFGGQNWLIVFAAYDDVIESAERKNSKIILSLGLLISLLVPGLFLIIARSNRQAAALRGLTISLENKNRQLEAHIGRYERSEEELKARVVEIAAINEILTGREGRLIELKEEVNRLSAELGRKQPYPPLWKNMDVKNDSP